MKITYEFNTNSEDFDPTELEMHRQALNMMVALGKIKEMFRSWLKYDSCPRIDKYSHFWEDLSDEEKEHFEQQPHYHYDLDKMADEFYDILADSGVNMEKLGY